MNKPFKKLRAEMSPAAKEFSDKIAGELRQKIRLTKLHRTSNISPKNSDKLPDKT